MRKFIQLKSKYLLLILLLLTGCNLDFVRKQIRAVGSSTLYPFVTIGAEIFGKKGKFKTPVIEATGTGGGFHLFCSGIGNNFPDIVNASRKISLEEIKFCKKHNISAPEEIILGFDGIVLATSSKTKNIKLNKKQIFLALAPRIPKNGKLIKNYYEKWSDIDPSLPNYKIEIYGPSFTSGTREIFIELTMQSICKNLPEVKKEFPDEKYRNSICSNIREDGKYIEMGENENLIIQKLVRNKQAVGILGYNFVAQNTDKIKSIKIDNNLPNPDTIASGKYSLSRPLYIYVKKEHYSKVPGLKEFIHELTSNDAIGSDGYLTLKGLISKKN